MKGKNVIIHVMRDTPRLEDMCAKIMTRKGRQSFIRIILGVGVSDSVRMFKPAIPNKEIMSFIRHLLTTKASVSYLSIVIMTLALLITYSGVILRFGNWLVTHTPGFISIIPNSR